MRTDRVLKLADHLDGIQQENPERFDLSEWGYEHSVCGTVGCVAGHAVSLFDPVSGYSDDGIFRSRDPMRAGAEVLGLSMEVAVTLFVPQDCDVKDYNDVTAADAARVLRHLAETGKVDWKILGRSN